MLVPSCAERRTGNSDKTLVCYGRWPKPVRDSGGQHDRRSAVISQVRGDARSVHFTPLKHDPSPSSGTVLARVGGWCGRWESNPHGLKPNEFSYLLRLSPPPNMGDCGLDYPFTMLRLGRRVGAARLVSTPSSVLSRRGLARDRHLTGFPEFEQFCIVSFPASTQSGLSPLRLPIPPRPHCLCGS